ncbi:MAG TPA: PIG-L family deacetylase [Anaerolineales bacterium]|nr:PIG-L family deacetylase [Anaerolineales bacterium]
MNWVVLSPHLDDAVYSCGGLIWKQTQAGDHVEIWTVCAGDPPPGPLSPFAQSLHTRWKTGEVAGEVRRAEDQRAASRLGAGIRHLDLPDCIYRRHPVSGEALYVSEEAIFGEVHPSETPVIVWLSTVLAKISRETEIVCPLTLGGHVDHRLVRAAAEQAGCVGRYYADYPYVAQGDANVTNWLPARWRAQVLSISEPGIKAWAEAIAMYSSQLSTFWPDRAAMEAELRGYLQRFGGLRLWSQELGKL